MERKINMLRCAGDDGATVFVVEHQYFDRRQTAHGERTYSGARRFALNTGEPVRLIDGQTYEIIKTGELIFLIR